MTTSNDAGTQADSKYTLITFATQWGSKFGGINSFNEDFLKAFGMAYYQSVQIICIVGSATPEAVDKAFGAHVNLVTFPSPPENKPFTGSQGQDGVERLKSLNITYDPEKTVW